VWYYFKVWHNYNSFVWMFLFFLFFLQWRSVEVSFKIILLK
jgi:hypothetical protein